MIETLTPTGFGPAEVGYFCAGLVIAVTALWYTNNKLVTRIMDRSDALMATVMGDQAKTAALLTDSVHRVETAIVKSDTANVGALGALNSSVTAAVTRLDRHEDRIDTLDGTTSLHGHRISVLETWTSTRPSP